MSISIKQFTGFKSIHHSIEFQPETPKKGKNLVDAGHVRNVFEFENCIEASVIRQASISQTPYNTKLWINDKRNIDKVSCTCVYGQSSKCKHVAAVIYFINNDQSITKTSEEKEWGVPSARLFATEKYSKGRSCEQMFMCKNKCFEEPISLKPPVKSSQLKAHSVLRSTLLKAEQDKCEVAVALVMENLLNQVEENVLYNEARGPISDILKVFFNSIEGQDVYVTNYDLDDNLKKIYDEKIFKTDNQIVNVCCETIKQSTCPTWFNERRLRLTASKDVHSIKTRRTKTVESLVKDLLKPNNFSVASTIYGQVNEPIARKIYEKCFKCEIKCVGLIISKKKSMVRC
uniref:Uncharacterized protein LOC114346832 n=1 Tax=Diabrotica virgifera virgifera TaxID=50390 RepID=A0A6P7H6M0_DIAVI